MANQRRKNLENKVCAILLACGVSDRRPLRHHAVSAKIPAAQSAKAAKAERDLVAHNGFVCRGLFVSVNGRPVSSVCQLRDECP